MSDFNLKIFDETLRDGEQQAGLFFPYETKVKLASLICNVGVSYIDIMPIIDKSEERLVKDLVAEKRWRNIITSSTMMGKNFIDHAKACGVNRIILFNAVSDRLLFLRDRNIQPNQNNIFDENVSESLINQIRQNMLDRVLDNLRYATSPEVDLKVEFAAEDASRADFDFLVQCVREFRPYIEHFMLCDTVGTLSPDKAYKWVYKIAQATNHAPLAVHFHNDLGMALENTLQAILAGASMVSGTFKGIGERAGNVSLEQVLNGLKERFGLEVKGINYDAVNRVVKYLESINAEPFPPYSRGARSHESGIHVNGILKDRKSYSNIPYQEPEIWFGKYSGASNFQYIFEKILRKSLPKDEYNKLRASIKALSLKEQRCFSAQEVISLYEQGALNV